MTSSEFPSRLSFALPLACRFGGILSLALVLLLACSEATSEPTATPEPVTPGMVWANPPNCDPGAPAVSLSAARRDSVSYPGMDGWEIIGQHVRGGFAGWYFDANHRFTVNLVDTTDLASSLDALAYWWTQLHPSLTRDSVLINVVRWDWEQLRDWGKYLSVNQKLQNTVSAGRIDLDSRNRVHFIVWSDAARAVVLQRLLEIGIPCWLVMVETTLPCGKNGCLKSEQPPPAASGVVGL